MRLGSSWCASPGSRRYTPEEAAHFRHGGMGDPSGKEKVAVYYSFEVVSSLMACMDARAAKVADELGIEQLNLMPLLDPSLKTYYDYVHYTPTGAADVAAIIADAILRQQIPRQPSQLQEYVPALA
jgi:hypothetical protein